jgi:hypothetical protein
VNSKETPILLDYSKNVVNSDTMKLLFDVVRERGVEKGEIMVFEASFSSSKSAQFSKLISPLKLLLM